MGCARRALLTCIAMPGLALCLHGKVSGSASATHLERTPACKHDPRFHYNRSLAAHIRLAHWGMLNHIIEPNRAKGVEVGVFMHSWTPEARLLLDELYLPSASVHEDALPHLDKVRSQHLSLRRCIALIPYRFGHVLVSRFDVVFLTPVLVNELAAQSGLLRSGRRPTVWLPHTCQALLVANATVMDRIRTTCGCGDGRCARHREVGRGQLVTAPYTTRHTTGERLKASLSGTAANFLSWVLDYWFIGTRDAAQSFGGIYEHFFAYKQELQQLDTSCECGRAA